MSMTDPIGDMLTRIRNASSAKHEKVLIPGSGIKTRVAEVLKAEGFIKDFILHKDDKQGSLTVVLRYGPDREPAITGIRRTSKPGLRRYSTKREIPEVLNGLGISILSTSQGVMVDREARAKGVGGELLCTVW
ncbi:MAG: 30S ribosomal protein S8 [Isosphaeraceae bacterium]